MSKQSLEHYLANGGRLSSPDNATPRYRGELMRLMAVFVDSEMAGAAGFADAINFAPGIRERIVASRIVLEKFSNAKQVLDVMEGFGANVSRYANQHPWTARVDRNFDLGKERMGSDARLNVFYYPIENWCDAVVMNTLMGLASVNQLGEYADCSYQPLCDATAEILATENRHYELGISGIEHLFEYGFNTESAQSSVNYWYPRVADTFGHMNSERYERLKRFGLRRNDNEQLLKQWRERSAEMLKNLGLAAPAT